VDAVSLADELFRRVDAKRERLGSIVRYLHDNPEIGGMETESAAFLCEILRTQAFEIQVGVAGLPTAFVGTFCGSDQIEPRVAFVVEYDALPSLGHACGHNASAAASMGACLALAEVMREHRLPGTCMAAGTPGEENLAGKIPMIKAGIFHGVSAVMMAHAYDHWIIESQAMALDAMEFSFKGRPAHGAVAPHEGINALDAVMLTFHGINCLRQHVLDGSRIHGIVTHGGDAPNIVPEKAVAEYYVRARNSEYLKELTRRVQDCARGAALATGCELEITTFEPHQDNLKSNKVLLELFRANLSRWVDSSQIIQTPEALGSTDMGNLSHAVPSIHPLMPVAPKGVNVHTHEFARATLSEEALNTVVLAASAMACTALDIILDEEKRDAVAREFGG
jgi:amidohydrolase